MRQDKIVTRIILILSVVNVALAAPAVVRQGRQDPDVAGAASEKRDGSDDESKLASSASSKSLAGSDSTFSASSGGPHSGSVGSAPGTPDVLAHWEALIGLPQPGSESESEPGSSRHSTPPPSPPPPHPDELAAAPENHKADTFFNDALKQKIKIIGGLGAVLGVSGSVVYGLHKLISSPQAEPVGRDIASSDVVGTVQAQSFTALQTSPELHRALESFV